MPRSTRLLLVLLVLASPAPAEPPPGEPEVVSIMTDDGWRIPDIVLEQGIDLARIEVSPATRRLVAQLGAASFAEREAAVREMVEREIATLEIYHVLCFDAPDPEQRCRLLRVLRQLLLSAPRGALGIQMQTAGTRGGVTVTKLIEGLPARDVLRLQDRIVLIEGNPVRSSNDLIELVQTRRPGDVLRLSVERPRYQDDGTFARDDAGEVIHDPLEVSVRLGDARNLRDPTDPIPRTQSVVMQQRRRESEFADRHYAPRPRRVPLAPRLPVTGER